MNLPNKTPQRYLNLYFQVHQPKRLRPFGFFEIGKANGHRSDSSASESTPNYFDHELNKSIIKRVAKQCYLPTNILLLKLINRFPEIRITFSISGTALEQLEEYAPETLETFRMLAATGSVEFLSETYYHSLSFLAGRNEFVAQINQHSEKLKTLFGISPMVFRNTELIYSDGIGRTVHELGYKGIFLDGAEKAIGHLSPHNLYNHPDSLPHPDEGLKLFLRNYRLSDDIAFRFSQKSWSEWPLSAKKFVKWLEQIPEKNTIVNIGMDYETFGEHQKKESGILNFLEQILTGIIQRKKYKMVTPSEAIELIEPRNILSVPKFASWADTERDLSAWLGNDMQQDAFQTLLQLEKSIKKIQDPALLDTWRNLQTSDHFYYMSTKHGDDGAVHTHFSPYPSPYEAFMNYMNVLSDFSMRVRRMVERRDTVAALDGEQEVVV
jgi:alpha-amylase